MPRKSSKTDNVLDLISGKEEEEKKKSAARKSVKVVDNEPNKELSDVIKDKLAASVKGQGKKNSLPKEESDNKKISETAKKIKPKAGKSFNYINVMEAIVKNDLEKNMVEFDMCTCEHCMADVMALTLTKLPAKYVVTDSSVSPLLNYYASKYNDIVNIELMKACTLIKEYPHHNRK